MLLASRLPALAQGPPPLKVVGNQIRTADGHVAHLRGVNIPSLEWGQGEHLSKSLAAAVGDWKANIVRLPLSQDRWFGHTMDKKDGGVHYRKTVRDFVDKAAGLNCYVILDLHWNDGGVWGQHIGQHKMPDDRSLEFWKAAAAAYAGQSNVLLGLYNEPHDVPWQIWHDGGQVSEADKKAARASRNTRRTRRSIKSCSRRLCPRRGRQRRRRRRQARLGLEASTGIVKGHALTDPKGYGVVYDTHIYPMKKWFTHGTTKSQDWDRLLLPTAAKYPVIVGEFGDGKDNYAGKVLEFADQNHLPWIGWCMHTGAKPCLIKDWNYTPTAFGELVKVRKKYADAPDALDEDEVLRWRVRLVWLART